MFFIRGSSAGLARGQSERHRCARARGVKGARDAQAVPPRGDAEARACYRVRGRRGHAPRALRRPLLLTVLTDRLVAQQIISCRGAMKKMVGRPEGAWKQSRDPWRVFYVEHAARETV